MFQELIDAYSDSGDYDGDYDYESAVITLKELDEAVSEVEALQDGNSMYYIEAMKLSQPKECSIECKHIVLGLNSCGSTMDCKKGFKCSRVFKDEFEIKDEQ